MNQTTNTEISKPFLKTLQGQISDIPPVWLMRQAGRYLPEYMEIRKKAGSFLNLCYNPDMATEVTLQPIRRYGFDAAILFSDILVVPDALGQKVEFETGFGPKLDPITDEYGLKQLDINATPEKFEIVYETVEKIKGSLPDEVALIGFCGAPWTVATYMIAGQGTKDQEPTRMFAYRHPEIFMNLIDILVETSAQYLIGQIEAGAEALQIFDSWSGVLPDSEFEKWCVQPTKKLIAQIREVHPDIPIIGFPKDAESSYIRFVEETGVNAVSCGTSMSLDWIKTNLQPITTVQGNLDPMLLISGGEELERRVHEIKTKLSGHPHIFNLGHGITPLTPPDNVARLVELIRSPSV